MVVAKKTFSLRMPPDLHATLSESARKNGRSVTREIVTRLRVQADQETLTAAVEAAVRRVWAERAEAGREAWRRQQVIDALNTRRVAADSLCVE